MMEWLTLKWSATLIWPKPPFACQQQERPFRKVTSVSIHSFIEWLDTFPYALRPAVKEVSHIRCFAIDIAEGLILFSCRLAMQHLCVLQLETALATLVTTWVALADLWWRSRYRSSDQSILNALGSRNATTGWSGNNLTSASLFSIPFQWWRKMPEIFSTGDGNVRRWGTHLLIFFSLYSRRSVWLISLAFENALSITLSFYPVSSNHGVNLLVFALWF